MKIRKVCPKWGACQVTPDSKMYVYAVTGEWKEESLFGNVHGELDLQLKFESDS